MTVKHEMTLRKGTQHEMRDRSLKQRIWHTTKKKRRTEADEDFHVEAYCLLCKIRGHDISKCKDICLPCFASYKKLDKDYDSPATMEPISKKKKCEQMTSEYYRSLQRSTSLAKYPIHLDQDCPLRCFVCHNIRHSPSECLKVCQYHTKNYHAVGKCPETCNYCGYHGHVLMSCSLYSKNHNLLSRNSSATPPISVSLLISTQKNSRRYRSSRGTKQIKPAGAVTLGSYINYKLLTNLRATTEPCNTSKRICASDKSSEKPTVCFVPPETLTNHLQNNMTSSEHVDNEISRHSNDKYLVDSVTNLQETIVVGKFSLDSSFVDFDGTYDFISLCYGVDDHILPVFYSVTTIPSPRDPVHIPEKSGYYFHDPVIRPPSHILF